MNDGSCFVSDLAAGQWVKKAARSGALKRQKWGQHVVDEPKFGRGPFRGQVRTTQRRCLRPPLSMQMTAQPDASEETSRQVPPSRMQRSRSVLLDFFIRRWLLVLRLVLMMVLVYIVAKLATLSGRPEVAAVAMLVLFVVLLSVYQPVELLNSVETRPFQTINQLRPDETAPANVQTINTVPPAMPSGRRQDVYTNAIKADLDEFTKVVNLQRDQLEEQSRRLASLMEQQTLLVGENVNLQEQLNQVSASERKANEEMSQLRRQIQQLEEERRAKLDDLSNLERTVVGLHNDLHQRDLENRELRYSSSLTKKKLQEAERLFERASKDADLLRGERAELVMELEETDDGYALVGSNSTDEVAAHAEEETKKSSELRGRPEDGQAEKRLDSAEVDNDRQVMTKEVRAGVSAPSGEEEVAAWPTENLNVERSRDLLLEGDTTNGGPLGTGTDMTDEEATAASFSRGEMNTDENVDGRDSGVLQTGRYGFSRQEFEADAPVPSAEEPDRRVEVEEGNAADPLVNANKLLTRAKQVGGRRSFPLFKAAVELLEAEESKRPNDIEIIWGIGNALLSWGKSDPNGRYADEILAEAAQKFLIYSQLNPDNEGCYFNWGLTLCVRAAQKEGLEALKLYDSACGKYDKAVRINKASKISWFNYGLAVFSRARCMETDPSTLGGTEDTIYYYREARMRFERAIQLDSADWKAREYRRNCQEALQSYGIED